MINILACQFFHFYFFPSPFHSNDNSYFEYYIYRTLASFLCEYKYVFTVFTYGYFVQIFIQKFYIYNAVKYW